MVGVKKGGVKFCGGASRARPATPGSASRRLGPPSKCTEHNELANVKAFILAVMCEEADILRLRRRPQLAAARANIPACWNRRGVCDFRRAPYFVLTVGLAAASASSTPVVLRLCPRCLPDELEREETSGKYGASGNEHRWIWKRSSRKF